MAFYYLCVRRAFKRLDTKSLKSQITRVFAYAILSIPPLSNSLVFQVSTFKGNFFNGQLLQWSLLQNPTLHTHSRFIFLLYVPFPFVISLLSCRSSLFIHYSSNIHKTHKGQLIPYVCLMVEAQYIFLEKMLNK